jgi:hypothetical protein
MDGIATACFDSPKFLPIFYRLTNGLSKIKSSEYKNGWW